MTHIVVLEADLSLAAADTVLEIDISDFEDTDYISVALPDFPGSDVTKASSFFDITSDPDGNFDSEPTDYIPFTSSSPALPGTDGDAEARFPLSLLVNVDRSAITGIRFRVTVTGDTTFKVAAVRCLAADWEYAPFDIDTLYDRAHFAPSRDGDPAAAFEFPTTASPSWPADFPILWRADGNTSAEDPQPINSSISAFFSSGALETGNNNRLSFFYRTIAQDDQIQLELDDETMGTLNALGAQPDFGEAEFVTRDQEDLDLGQQSEYDGDSQTELERLQDYSVYTWLEIRLDWEYAATGPPVSGVGTISILDPDGEGYIFDSIPMLATSDSDFDQGQYILIMDIVDDSVRVRLYESNQVGDLDEEGLIFDSNKIYDDSFIKRRKGRFGWLAQFEDGDAFVYNLRTRGLNFGEVVTKPLLSNTPVKGAQLFTGTTSDKELVSAILGSPWGVGDLRADPAASATGEAFKVINRGGLPLQGIATNEFVLDNFSELDIRFKIKFPSQALLVPGGGLEVFLFGEFFRCVPLTLTPLAGDRWESVRARTPNDLLQTGSYRLCIVQSLPNVDTTWWIEALSVQTPMVSWHGRGVKDDPWHLVGDDDWMPFRNVTNKRDSGVVFRESGNSMQIRAQALRQAAEIHGYTVIPNYAQLGRFVWEDERPDVGAAPVADIDYTTDDLSVQFNAFDAADSDGQIVAYYWNFGDGQADHGPSVSHTYAVADTYTVVLVVVDNYGNQGSTTVEVTVTA